MHGVPHHAPLPFFQGYLYSLHRDISWNKHLRIYQDRLLNIWTYSSFYWHQFEWIKVSHQWKTRLEVKLFMYDNNDVIRKKIILNIFASSSAKKGEKSVFAFSSWLSLILILWLFSDHIQMGIRRKRWDERWCKNEWNIFELKLFMNMSSTAGRDAPLDADPNMSTQSRYQYCSQIVIDMHRNWKIINFVSSSTFAIIIKFSTAMRQKNIWFSFIIEHLT